ncbi:PGAP1-like alpha/beta domain-containing protein [Streptomyces sp. NPDC000229]|uniref:PGAP1-like alpha/beta domain-containing protein n=1 Tax=Streptomyces sp. NPDC000229 TaxID=3154247 RepID=UPI00332112DD
MSATLVLVHGRKQEWKAPLELQRMWQAGLAAGLMKAGLPPVDVPVVFPYFGNLLRRITDELAQSHADIDLETLPADPNRPGPLHPYLGSDIGIAERKMLEDMAVGAGWVFRNDDDELERLSDVLSWKVARDALDWLAHRTPFDQEFIAAHLCDVAVYLTRARTRVLSHVREQLPSDGPVILVSHSLGTVVARDLLGDADLRARTRLWVTAGSPLGIDAVRKNLGDTTYADNPGVEWLSAYDVNDIVALGHPLRKKWGPPLEDIEVENGDEPHSIERYLAHPQVAGPIGAALASP